MSDAAFRNARRRCIVDRLHPANTGQFGQYCGYRKRGLPFSAALKIRGDAMKMHFTRCLGFGMLISLSAGSARETTVVSDVLGPEGPLYVDGTLYYVGWISNA